MTDVNEIQAGEYELVALLWDEPLSKPGEPFNFTRHRRGDTVQLSAEDARRLVPAGAVVKPGALQLAAVAQAQAQLAALVATLPPDLQQQIESAGLPEPEQSTPPSAEPRGPAASPVPVGTVGTRPAQVALKADWVAYAITQGMTAEDAEAATKDKLIELYGA